MTTAADVRRDLINTLRLDLIGPRPGNPSHAAYEREVLATAPSSWYLTGFLVPYEAPVEDRSDDTGDDELDQASRLSAGDDENIPEQASARRGYFPSSMGLSVLVPGEVAPGKMDTLQVKVAWGEYVPIDDLKTIQPSERFGRGGWRRMPRASERVVDIRPQAAPQKYELPNSDGLQLVVSVRSLPGNLLPPGTRSVSVFLVNHRSLAEDGQRDAAWIFQPELTLESTRPLVQRPNFRGRETTDWDEKVADLQYRDVYEYAVGHNVSALALHAPGEDCFAVRSSWMPEAAVEKVVAARTGGELGIETLAEAQTAGEVRQRIGPMVTEYGAWIANQTANGPQTGQQGEVTRELMANADRTRRRIEDGLASLDDPHVFEAFRLANRVIARAIRQRACHDRPGLKPEDLDPPAWRPFQLAFLLMNLPGMVEHKHPDRKVVDLLFFPTGGGKTEAYLGLAAFTLALRRLRDPSIRSAGLSVLMRYTLRLLTLDQLGRAATLICALELERQNDIERLGRWPFEIGLWVGQAATPNRMGKKGDKDSYSARARTIAYKNNDRNKPSPIPLEECPWCGKKFNKNSFRLLPDIDKPTDLRVSCVNRQCEFHSRRQVNGLPILAVDDVIYRRLPAFMIATVDKFAGLPWVGETAGLFGRIERYDKDGFYGPARGGGRPLPPSGGRSGLPPMDLVIQDELHLISGPLGTMVGLYETAIDALAAENFDGESPRPKIVASTATVRRAEKQIRALFGRTCVDIFPPPGPDRRNSFFAKTVPPNEREPRLYLGVAAQGRNLKVVLLRSYLALLAAAQKAWEANGGARNPKNPADPYMTLLGYFNSLRELGGSRRIVEDEVHSRLADYGQRRRRVGEAIGLFADRTEFNEPEELTSRVSTNEVAETKRRLKLSAREQGRVDVALATNMISVGLDISRLGLMAVLGQPKSASEYIQATSRVGRDDVGHGPGLVVTLMNIHRPRDRSHYERFVNWHESFYRAVEATSVTPFSPRAIDRGLAGVTVALARLGHAGMTAPKNAAAITRHRSDLDFVSEIISRRAEGHDGEHAGAKSEELRQKVRSRVVDLLDTWERIATAKGDLQYQREEGGAVPPLLYTPLDPELDRQPKEARAFKAHRSLRDVEPAVPLWLRRPDDLEEP